MADYSDEEDLDFPVPKTPAPDAATIVEVPPRGDVVEHAFACEAPGATIRVQIVLLGDAQLYVWIGEGVGDAARGAMNELGMAIETRMSSTPIATTLFNAGGGGGGGGGGGMTMTDSLAPGGGGGGGAAGGAMTDSLSNALAVRLAKRTGRCVVASVNLPADMQLLQVFAERKVIEKLKELGM
jgi:hypothetical protein